MRKILMVLATVAAACGGADVDEVDFEHLPACDLFVVYESPPGATGPQPALVEFQLTATADDRCEELSARAELLAPAAVEVVPFECDVGEMSARGWASFDGEPGSTLTYELALVLDGQPLCRVERSIGRGGMAVLRLR